MLDSITFAYPWMIALSLPLVASVIYRIWKAAPPHHRIPSQILLQDIPRTLKQRMRPYILSLLWLIVTTVLIAAASRPQHVEPMPQQHEARNVFVALDLSRSMEADDFRVNGRDYSRIDGVKSVFTDLVSARPNDRIGIIVFGVRAFLQSPLTLDHELLTEVVQELQCGLAGDGTAIGDGLGLSIKRIKEVPAQSRVVILITDGVNNSGDVNPLKAAHVARDLGITVHTIGIGSARKGGEFEFDEALLRQIAEMTGGLYAHAGSAEELRAIYRKIEELETSHRDLPRGVQVTEYYSLLCWIALGLMVIVLILQRTIFLVLPR
jgi:Ca-activated chloride channel family protein